jgi:2-polyprenyl-3-methyl-5-hydroxy-6-metoxy-1,4-benzoquinol methylase
MDYLNFERIEVNAYGPYNHGVWKNHKTGNKIGKEEFLAGRSNYIFEKFCEFMQQFTEEQICTMSLIDIGSYDGWFANEIEKRFNFNRIVSSESRLKNIQKGIAVRKFLDISSRFEIRQENLEDIQEGFDIVVCIGVLHHVGSVSQAIKKLSSISKMGLFIETQIYEPLKILENNYFGAVIQWKHDRRVIEPKDVVYVNKKRNPADVAISGHKYESYYSDGSTSFSQVVELPSIAGLKLNLLANDFSEINLLTTSKEYGKKLVNRNFRVYKATILGAMRSKGSDENRFMDVKESIFNYERLHFVNFLSQSTVMDLQMKQGLGVKREIILKVLLVIRKIPINLNNLLFLEKVICKLFSVKYEEIENLKVLKFDFKNKLSFEIAKLEICNRNYEQAKGLLIEVVEAEDADWRSTYRSFFLLYLLARMDGKEQEEEFFRENLRKSNNAFPIELESIVLEALGLNLNSKN